MREIPSAWTQVVIGYPRTASLSCSTSGPRALPRCPVSPPPLPSLIYPLLSPNPSINLSWYAIHPSFTQKSQFLYAFALHGLSTLFERVRASPEAKRHTSVTPVPAPNPPYSRGLWSTPLRLAPKGMDKSVNIKRRTNRREGISLE